MTSHSTPLDEVAPADVQDERCSFKEAIQSTINAYSKENGCNTPDFILAEFLTSSLAAFDIAVNARSKWYGKSDAPCQSVEDELNKPVFTGTVTGEPELPEGMMIVNAKAVELLVRTVLGYPAGSDKLGKMIGTAVMNDGPAEPVQNPIGTLIDNINEWKKTQP